MTTVLKKLHDRSMHLCLLGDCKRKESPIEAARLYLDALELELGVVEAIADDNQTRRILMESAKNIHRHIRNTMRKAVKGVERRTKCKTEN